MCGFQHRHQRQADQRGDDAEIGIGAAVPDEAFEVDDVGADGEVPVQQPQRHVVIDQPQRLRAEQIERAVGEQEEVVNGGNYQKRPGESGETGERGIRCLHGHFPARSTAPRPAEFAVNGGSVYMNGAARSISGTSAGFKLPRTRCC